MSKSIRLIWSLIKSDKLVMEIRNYGVEVPVLKDEVQSECVRKATSRDIKYIFESEAWRNMVLRGVVFYV